jgi:Tol biopolymer transport system component
MRKILTILLVSGTLALGLGWGQQKDQTEVDLQAAIRMETVEGNLKGAIEQYKRIAAQPGAGRTMVATALLRMGQCYEKLGNTEARSVYEHLVREYGDQAEMVALARVRLSALGRPADMGGPVARRILADASGVGAILSAEGKIFSRVDSATGDVVQFDIAGGGTKRIKNTGPWSSAEQPIDDPVFSRDGKLIADNPEKLSETKEWLSLLRIRNLDGSGSRTLLAENKYIAPLGWSPDGKSVLAVVQRGRVTELAWVSTADGSVHALKTLPDWLSLGRVALSPDGQWIASSLQREGGKPQSDVFLMSAASGKDVIVAEHPAEDEFLAWAPDGKSLVFLSNRSGTWDIWRAPIAEGRLAGEPELLRKDFGYHVWDVLGFAPDGSLYTRIDATFGRLFTGEIDLETGKVLAPPVPVMTRFTSPPTQIRWSPDGKELAYMSNRGSMGPANNFLMIRSAATGEERQLTPRLRFINQISWAPDGQSIIALGVKIKGVGFFRIDAATSEISDLGGEGVAPCLCSDGKTLLYIKGGPFLVKRNLETGAETKIVDIRGMNYSISPDEREVMFIDPADGSAKSVSLAGGEPRLVYKGPAQSATWTRDGKSFIVLVGGQRWRIPAGGGAPVKLELLIPNVQYFALNPDNRRFALGVTDESKSELWVLENFLPAPKVAK